MSQIPEVEYFDLDDISLKEKPVRRNGKTIYILREASGDAGRIYKNAIQAAIKYGEDGEISSITGMADTRTLLLSHCLIEADDKGNPIILEQDKKSTPKFVHISLIRSWPTRVTEPMIEWIKTVSELSEPDTIENIDKQIKALQKRRAKLLKGTEAKNELNGTVDG